MHVHYMGSSIWLSVQKIYMYIKYTCILITRSRLIKKMILPLGTTDCLQKQTKLTNISKYLYCLTWCAFHRRSPCKLKIHTQCHTCILNLSMIDVLLMYRLKEIRKQHHLLTWFIWLKSMQPDKYNACTLQRILILAFSTEKSIHARV